MLYQLDSVFNLGFFISEIQESSNIKDRKNRQYSVQNLKTLHAQLKSYAMRNIKLQRGIICFAGVTNTGDQILYVFEPPIGHECTSFVYRCSSKFEWEHFKCFQQSNYKPQTIILIVLITGDETGIYSVATSASTSTTVNGISSKVGTSTDIKFTKIASVQGSLTKKHGKGGQSSVRFQRLADASRDHYCTRVSDRLRAILSSETSTTSSIPSTRLVLFAGPENYTKAISDEIKNITKLQFIVTPWTCITNSESSFLHNHKKEIADIIINLSKPELQDKLIAQISTFLVKDPDWLLFGQDIDSRIVDCQCILVIESKENILWLKTNDNNGKCDDKIILIDKSSPHYAELASYSRIGLLFHKNSFRSDIDDDEVEDENNSTEL